MEGQSKGLRGLETYCKGGQGPPQAVAPLKDEEFLDKWHMKVEVLHARVQEPAACPCVGASRETFGT